MIRLLLIKQMDKLDKPHSSSFVEKALLSYRLTRIHVSASEGIKSIALAFPSMFSSQSRERRSISIATIDRSSWAASRPRSEEPRSSNLIRSRLLFRADRRRVRAFPKPTQVAGICERAH
jgi:hypothetical protein